MEYCENGSLEAKYLANSEIDTWRFLSAMSSALEYIHAKGIIHRDIKPQNILCKRRSDGKIVLKMADFGIAKLLNRQHYGQFYASTCIGTATYMSPEALNSFFGERYGKSADIWSLGALVSFFCNRRHLFQSEYSVRRWPGGISTLDRNKYCFALRQLTAHMMDPDESLRPSAKLIYKKASPRQNS